MGFFYRMVKKVNNYKYGNLVVSEIKISFFLWFFRSGICLLCDFVLFEILVFYFYFEFIVFLKYLWFN